MQLLALHGFVCCISVAAILLKADVVVQGCSCNSMFVTYVAAQRGFTAKTLAVGVFLSICDNTTGHDLQHPGDFKTRALFS